MPQWKQSDITPTCNSESISHLSIHIYIILHFKLSYNKKTTNRHFLNSGQTKKKEGEHKSINSGVDIVNMLLLHTRTDSIT